jgi:type IV pilus assembly protein PilW
MSDSRKYVGVSRHWGLTLVELLIALVMGLVLLGGVVTVFVANKQTYRHQDALARLQENGRYAINRLERDIRRANATFGCQPANIINTLNNLSDGSSSGCPGTTLVPIGGSPIFGRDNVTGVTVAGKTVKNGTDILQILIGVGGQCKILQHGPLSSAQLKVDGNCSQLQDFDIVMVVNDLTCERAAVFQITNTNARPDGNNHHIEVVHNQGRGFPGNCQKEFQSVYEGGYLVQIAYRTYFISTGASGLPSLFLYEAGGAAQDVQELVEGVEDMQLLFGVDTDSDNDRAVDAYLTAAQVEAAGQWPLVRSVRPNLLLQSVDPAALAEANDIITNFTGFHDWNVNASDKRWRQVYSATVGVRGRLP